MNENEVSNALIFSEVNILEELKAKGTISQDCNDEKEAYEQATRGW